VIDKKLQSEQLQVKFAPELAQNDIIIHNHKKYLVEKYGQCGGMGCEWGEYGILRVREVRRPVWIDSWRNLAKVGDEVANKKVEEIQTYQNYPFIVIGNNYGNEVDI
jgi:hypothetical protein